MKLTMAIESTNDPDFLPRLIPYLVSEPLADVLKEPFVASLSRRCWRAIAGRLTYCASAQSANREPFTSTSAIKTWKATTSLSLIICTGIPCTALG